MFGVLFDLLFPPASDAPAFADCPGRPFILGRHALDRTGAHALDSLHAARRYDDSDTVRTLIRRYKYGRERRLVSSLAGLLQEVWCTSGFPRDAVLVPVPLHWTRHFSRGFNQSDLLARALSSIVGHTVMPLLRRTRPTGHQAWRSGAERRAAMRTVFRCTSRNVPTHVVLVDDVATTCATLDACARELKHAGVHRVDAIVVALG